MGVMHWLIQASLVTILALSGCLVGANSTTSPGIAMPTSYLARRYDTPFRVRLDFTQAPPGEKALLLEAMLQQLDDPSKGLEAQGVGVVLVEYVPDDSQTTYHSEFVLAFPPPIVPFDFQYVDLNNRTVTSTSNAVGQVNSYSVDRARQKAMDKLTSRIDGILLDPQFSEKVRRR
jgi:hypothetical protein